MNISENPYELVAYKSEYEKKNRIVKWAIHIIPLFNEENKADFTVCVVKDLSDTNHWQRDFNLLFEKVPNLIAVLTRISMLLEPMKDSKIRLANQVQVWIYTKENT